MIVSSSTRKPQKVAACAIPGTVHFSSFRCPITSVSCVSASRPGCVLAYSRRSGAGWPLNASRFSHHTRRPATANAATVSTRPTTIRTIMPGLHGIEYRLDGTEYLGESQVATGHEIGKTGAHDQAIAARTARRGRVRTVR